MRGDLMICMQQKEIDIKNSFFLFINKHKLSA